jgi:hypothetical protein
VVGKSLPAIRREGNEIGRCVRDKSCGEEGEVIENQTNSRLPSTKTKKHIHKVKSKNLGVAVESSKRNTFNYHYSRNQKL